MIQSIYAAFRKSSGICTDTRKLKQNGLFIALKGPNFNANDYVVSALQEGCGFAIVDEGRTEFKGDQRIFLVKDALLCLQELAAHHRARLKIPIIGLTGSNGKTTTKELLLAALSQQYSCYATKGNLNNHIGVPLSLLEIDSKHEIAIIEMGANHQKEIKFLAEIAKPTYGLITNIGKAHLEGFGGEMGVFKGKKELFDFIRETKGSIFINQDDEKVVQAASGLVGTTYGADSSSDYTGIAHSKNGFLMVEWVKKNQKENILIDTQLTGTYNFSNVMAAITVSSYFGVSAAKIKTGISTYSPANQRSQVIYSQKGNTLIVDCYNANPSSMEAAIVNVSKNPTKPVLAILGIMKELGDSSEVEHTKVLELLKEQSIEQAYLIGQDFQAINSEFNPSFKFFKTTEEALAFLESNPINNQKILLKGSRAVQLERLIPSL